MANSLLLDEEVKAVQIMATALRENPQVYTILHAQCDFLRAKGKYDWALKLARQAVNCAPSEFVTWEKLTTVYIELGEYESVCRFCFTRSAVNHISLPRHRLSSRSTLVPCSPTTAVTPIEI